MEAIDTPNGMVPRYEDLKKLFAGIGKEENLPPRLFKVYEEQQAALLAVKEKFGAVVDVEKLA